MIIGFFFFVTLAQNMSVNVYPEQICFSHYCNRIVKDILGSCKCFQECGLPSRHIAWLQNIRLWMFLWWGSDCGRINNWLSTSRDPIHLLEWQSVPVEITSAMALHKWLESSETDYTITAAITLLFCALRALSDCARLRIVTFQTASLVQVW